MGTKISPGDMGEEVPARKVVAPEDLGEAIEPAPSEDGRDWEHKLGDRVGAFSQGLINTVTAGFGDEVIGALTIPTTRTSLQQHEEREKFDPANRGLTPEQKIAKAHQKFLEQEAAAPNSSLSEKGRALVEGYRKSRDAYRQSEEDSKTKDPGWYTGGQVAGAFIPTGGGAAKTLGQHVARGAAFGAAAGLGNSKADLTKGELADAGIDTGIGTALGAGTGVVSRGLRAGTDKLADSLGAVASRGRAAAPAQAEAKVMKKIAQAQSKYRSGVQSASRDLEVLRDLAQEPSAIQDSIQDFLKTDDAKRLIEKVGAGKLATAPQRIQEMDELLQAFKELNATKSQDIAAKEAELLKPLTPAINYVKKYAPRAAMGALGGVVGAGITHLTGAPTLGTTAGTIAGALGGAAIGDPGTALKNVTNHPGLRVAVGSLGQAFFSGLGKYGAYLQAAAARSPQALVAAHEFLKAKFPDYPAFAVEQKLNEADAGSP